MSTDEEIDAVQQTRRPAAGAPALQVDASLASPFEAGKKFLADRGLTAEEVQARPKPQPLAAPQASPPAKASRTLLRPRAIETLQACGPLTIEQLADGMGIELITATTLVRNGLSAGTFERATDRQGRDVVQLVKAKRAHGLKKHLSKSAKPPAAPKAHRGRKPGAAAGGKKAAKKAATPKVTQRKPSPALVKRSRRQAAQKARALPAEVQRSVGVVPAPPLPARVAPVPVAGFACGLYSDGQFHIKARAGQLLIERDELRAMVDYLDRVGTAAMGAAS